MKLFGKELISALALAAALAAPAAHASDQVWINGDLLDTSSVAPMPERLTFEEASSAASEPALAVPGPGVVAVPEPTTYLLLLAGLGIMGFVALRRK